MKLIHKTIIVAIAVITFTACNSKTNKAENRTSSTSETAKPATTGKDGELTKWLSGKMLISAYNDPQYDLWNNLKLNVDGSCIDKSGSTAKWVIEDGKFKFLSSVINMTEDMEKKSDTSLIFKGEIKDALYILKPIQ